MKDYIFHIDSRGYVPNNDDWTDIPVPLSDDEFNELSIAAYNWIESGEFKNVNADDEEFFLHKYCPQIHQRVRELLEQKAVDLWGESIRENLFDFDIYIPEEAYDYMYHKDYMEIALDCRYFNDEKEAPDSIPENKKMFWDYERAWVYEFYMWGEDHAFRKDVLHFTELYDLPNLIPEDDAPISLKALLFNRYDHWIGFQGGSREEYAQQFKEWYLRDYVADTKTHRQLLNGH